MARFHTIENHYQSSKVFKDGQVPTDWRQAKEMKRSGLRQVGWKIGPRLLKTRQDPRDLSAFALEDFGVQLYCLLWCKYIRCHPELVEHACAFDAFADPFAGSFSFSQARTNRVARPPTPSPDDPVRVLLAVRARLATWAMLR